MAHELIGMAYEAGLNSHEMEDIFEELGEIGEERYNQLLKTLSERITSPLIRLRNGEGLLMSQINKAVKQAANNEK